MTITATRTAERETFLADAITTAAEGSIHTWADVQVYRWHRPGILGGGAAPAPAGGGNAFVLLYDMDADAPFLLGLDTIEGAVARACGPEPIRGLSEDIRALIRTCAARDDLLSGHGLAGTIAADQLTQVAACGHVIYG